MVEFKLNNTECKDDEVFSLSGDTFTGALTNETSDGEIVCRENDTEFLWIKSGQPEKLDGTSIYLFGKSANSSSKTQKEFNYIPGGAVLTYKDNILRADPASENLTYNGTKVINVCDRASAGIFLGSAISPVYLVDGTIKTCDPMFLHIVNTGIRSKKSFTLQIYSSSTSNSTTYSSIASLLYNSGYTSKDHAAACTGGYRNSNSDNWFATGAWSSNGSTITVWNYGYNNTETMDSAIGITMHRLIRLR